MTKIEECALCIRHFNVCVECTHGMILIACERDVMRAFRLPIYRFKFTRIICGMPQNSPLQLPWHAEHFFIVGPLVVWLPFNPFCDFPCTSFIFLLIRMFLFSVFVVAFLRSSSTDDRKNYTLVADRRFFCVNKEMKTIRKLFGIVSLALARFQY